MILLVDEAYQSIFTLSSKRHSFAENSEKITITVLDIMIKCLYSGPKFEYCDCQTEFRIFI